MDEVNREDQLILEALERATTPEIPSAPLEDPVEDPVSLEIDDAAAVCVGCSDTA